MFCVVAGMICSIKQAQSFRFRNYGGVYWIKESYKHTNTFSSNYLFLGFDAIEINSFIEIKYILNYYKFD